MTRLDLMNKYSYYDVTASQRNLTKSEQVFFNFCMDNHNEICQESTPDEIMQPILDEAIKLEDDIYENRIENIENYTITNIHRGKNERRNCIYAQLRDEKGNLVIGATLEYIEQKLMEMTKEQKKQNTI